MYITIHRGTHQIGGTCVEVATENTRIILDIGEELPPLEGAPARQSITPRVKGLYAGDAPSIDAVFVSHYHGDHVGLIHQIHNAVPVYISNKAVNIINKIARFTRKPEFSRPTGELTSGVAIKVGDFEVTPFLVDHSAFEAYAFIIRAEGKTIVYSGDLRAHGRKEKATRFFVGQIPKQVDALLLEGTMMSRGAETVETEDEIERQAADFMRKKEGPVFVLQSATNIDRLVGMYRAAKQSGRLFVIDIFTANIVSLLGGRIPRPGIFRDVKVFYPRLLARWMYDDLGESVMMKEFGRYHISREELIDRKDYCMLIRASMLDDLRRMGGLSDAGLILSLWSGYLQTGRPKRLIDFLRSRNAEVIHLHTSGHAEIVFLQEIAESCIPKMIIPIHTEQPRMFLEKFSNVISANDGERITVI